MKIAVCAKLVPATDNVLKISESKDSIADRGETLVVDDGDEYAIEEALASKQAHGGEVWVVTVGGLRSQEVLYHALAKGADKGVRIDSDLDDSETVSQVLAAFFKTHQFDLIVTGVESSDNSSAVTGVTVAEKLGLPHAMAVTKIEATEGTKMRLQREIRGGTYVLMEVELPAVISVQSGIRELTYVSTVKLMKARQRPIQSLEYADLGLESKTVNEARKTKIVEMSFRKGEKRTEFLKGEPIEVAQQLLEKTKGVLA
jgi:electron transfer flavoprotein beta subunit